MLDCLGDDVEWEVLSLDVDHQASQRDAARLAMCFDVPQQLVSYFRVDGRADVRGRYPVRSREVWVHADYHLDYVLVHLKTVFVDAQQQDQLLGQQVESVQ